MKMTFETAFVYLKQGKKIRRASMKAGWYYFVHRGSLLLNVPVEIGGETYASYFKHSPDGDDILAEDWEVLDESTR